MGGEKQYKGTVKTVDIGVDPLDYAPWQATATSTR